MASKTLTQESIQNKNGSNHYETKNSSSLIAHNNVSLEQGN